MIDLIAAGLELASGVVELVPPWEAVSRARLARVEEKLKKDLKPKARRRLEKRAAVLKAKLGGEATP